MYLVLNQDEEQVNLEHILPQNPRSGDWDQFTQDEQKTWSLRLGNMALLQKGANDRIGNKPWSEKKPVLEASLLTLTKQAGRETSWTKEAINKRQQSLATLAIETWSRQPQPT
ncbi:MAG: HNH endonuclease [Rubrobacter sp.]|nr:HNH endonuclease [Rubrobacter sp.]